MAGGSGRSAALKARACWCCFGCIRVCCVLFVVGVVLVVVLEITFSAALFHFLDKDREEVEEEGDDNDGDDE